MKKYLMLSFFFAFSSFINAQKIVAGFKVGAAMSHLNHSNYDPYIKGDSKLSGLESFVGGFVFEHKDSGAINAFQVEMLHHRSGARIEHSDGTIKKLSIDQLQIPILGKFKMSDYLYLTAGVYAGWIYDVREAGDPHKVLRKDFIKIDKGVLLGIQSHFEKGLFLDLRFNLGLSNLLSLENNGVNAPKPFMFNRVFDLCIGIKM